MSGQSAVTPAAISPAPRRLHDADLVYLYDGSFEGFLCCVFESFLQHEIPFAIWTPERETATLCPIREIATDHARAQRVFASFGKKLGAETEYLVTRDFLSGREDKELLLLRFLHLAFAGAGHCQADGPPGRGPALRDEKEPGLGGGQVPGLCPLYRIRRDAGGRHPPQELHPAPAAGAFLRAVPRRKFHDL